MQYNNLTEVLPKLASLHNKGITFIEGSEQENFLSYSSLFENAQQLLFYLQQKGLSAGDELVLQLNDNQQFLEVFWACILGGIIPIPLELAQQEETRLKVLKVWKYLNRPYLISTEGNLQTSNWAEYPDAADIVAHSLTLETLKGQETKGILNTPSPDDIAFIQFSSGSTGDPKGVVLTHRNLLANIDAIHKGIDAPPEGDLFFSWMPLTHDMGLIGFHLSPMLAGWQHYIMPSSLFVRSPNLWLRKIAEHRITFSASPNFGYRFVMKYFNTEKNADLDLSSLRVIVNGAEPISIEVCHAFTAQMAAYGLAPNVIFPVYGLAEASLAVAFSQIQDEPQALYLDRHALNLGQQVRRSSEGVDSIAFVNVGKAVKHTQFKITDEKGQQLGAEQIGLIHIKGDNVCRAYYNNPEATAQTISAEGWLNTGDLGALLDGNLYITGRVKDLIFVNGQNFYPHDLERIAEEVEGIVLGKVVIAASYDSKAKEEKVLAFLLFKSKNNKRFIQLANACRQLINQRTGVEIHHFIPIKKIPKTTSGKIRRFQLCQEYQQGNYDIALKELETLHQAAKNIAAPENETERQLQVIWQQVFSQEVGVEDSFYDLGGNSLKAGQLAGMIRQQWEFDLPLNVFFTQTTISALAKHIGKATSRSATTILTVAPQPFYPLSSVQRRLFYQWQMDKESLSYNLPIVLSLKGALESQGLQTAFEQLIQRHDSFRCAFEFVDGEARQSIATQVAAPFQEMKIAESEVAVTLKSLSRPFDLTQAPLCRCALLEIASDQHIFFLDFHHIIMDGISMTIALKELFDLYHGRALAPVEVQYKEYVAWEQSYTAQSNYDKQAHFWKDQLEGDLPLLQLNTDKARPAVWEDTGQRIPFSLSTRLSQKLEAFAQQEQLTSSLLFLAAYHILLAKYTRQEDVIVGIPVSGRSHTAFAQTPGMFVNNLAIRTYPKAEQPFLSYLRELRATYFEALDNQDYLFENLINDLQIKSSADRNLLFDSMFLFQNMELPDLNVAGLEIEKQFFDPGIAKYDLSIELMPQKEAFYFEIEYATALFEETTIRRMGQHFIQLIESIVSKPNQTISQIQILSSEERKQLLQGVNQTQQQFGEQNIVSLFESQYSSSQVALVHGQKEITYQELNEQANGLAQLLIEKGVAKEEKVVVIMNNSMELVISLLAILKAGAAFVPIDHQLPAARKQFIVEDSAARFLISNITTAQASSEFFQTFSEEHLILADDSNLVATAQNPERQISGTQLAYMIYTSGTTGQPKGVMIEHRNIANYLSWAIGQYVRGEQLASPLFTSLAFDLTITALFVPLLSGNTVFIYDQESPDESLQQIFENPAIGLVKLTPSHLRILEAIEISVITAQQRRCLVVGGEALSTQLANQIIQKLGGDVEIFNEYGPTETTVGCTIHQFDPMRDRQEFVPIGKPIANTKVYLLDEQQQLVPQGVSGELYVAGAGVGRGYWNKESLTSNKFLSNTFVAEERMYRTGDCARWLNGWTLDFQGRQDEQVKIRGHRIELEEIKNQLTQYPELHQAAVLAQSIGGQDLSLVAYIVGSEKLEVQALEAWLRRQLPAYMIPTYWQVLPSLPLTPNGKLDGKALRAVPLQTTRSYTAPSNEMEQLIATIFERILQQPKIGVKDDFYSLGGDSIKAVQIAAALREKGFRLKAKDILVYRTIEQISYEVVKMAEEEKLGQAPLSGERAFSPIEHWFFNQQFNAQEHYNQSALLAFKKPIDKRILEQTFEYLISHFDGLRMNYRPIEKKAFYNSQHLDASVAIDVVDVSELRADQQLIKLEEIGEALKSQFDITQSLLIKAAVIRFSESTEKLLITAHHLIIDGLSWRILLTEFYRIYQSLQESKEISFPPKTVSVRQWVAALRNAEEEEQDYWNKLETIDFSLPTDISLYPFFEKDKIVLSQSLEKPMTANLLQNAQEFYKADPMIMLSLALARSLQEWTGQARMIIEMENHGRHLDDVDVSATIGWFTALYPLYLELQSSAISEQIIEVKEQIRRVPNHGINYGKYRQSFATEIRLNYLGQFAQEVNNDLFTYEALNSGREISGENHMTAKITLNAMIVDGALRIDIEYNSELYKASTMQQFKNQLFDHLHQIIEELEKQHTIHLSPSDFDAVELDAGDLESLFS